jgi:hypothetical protein
MARKITLSLDQEDQTGKTHLTFWCRDSMRKVSLQTPEQAKKEFSDYAR